MGIRVTMVYCRKRWGYFGILLEKVDDSFEYKWNEEFEQINSQ